MTISSLMLSNDRRSANAVSAILCHALCWFAISLTAQLLAAPSLIAQSPVEPHGDRFIAATIPLSDPLSAETRAVQTLVDQQTAESKIRPSNVFRKLTAADAANGLPAWEVAGWHAYTRLWDELGADPAAPVLRKYLGLPIGELNPGDLVAIKSARGRSAPSWLGWKSGTYLQMESPHFQIFSRADERITHEVATDLERVFWLWTQLFFPLWDAQPQVALHLQHAPLDQPISAALAEGSARLSSRRKLRVVLLKDAEDYVRTLGQAVPGIEQSTGFYSDERLTSFFYPSSSNDAVASRRHELVHQLFRESTRSRSTGPVPGVAADFWLIEGIAGYFEALQFNGDRASVGGWDSPRLQFARYRVLGSRDLIPLAELRAAGQIAVQNRSDLARWYANAIAYTHLFLDSDSASYRRWIYHLLASLYRVPIEVPVAAPTQSPATPSEPSAERLLVDFLRIDDQDLLANPTERHWSELCLSGCQTSATGLATIQPSSICNWIDLSNQSVSVADVTRLCSAPTELNQLSLEATACDDTIATWLAQASKLKELDLSWTACGDATIVAIAHHTQLQTLWLTGSKVSDDSISTLAGLSQLQSIDVQRTQISPEGLAKLRMLRPDCKINPLQLRP